MDYQMDNAVTAAGPDESISIRIVKEVPSSGSNSLAVLGADPDAGVDDSISASSYKSPAKQFECYDELLEDLHTFADAASMMATTATSTATPFYNFSDSPSSSTSYSPPQLLDSNSFDLSPFFIGDFPSMDFHVDVDMSGSDGSNTLGLGGGVYQDWSSANWDVNLMESEMQKAIIEEDFFHTFQESILQEPLGFFSLPNTTTTTTSSKSRVKQPKVIPFQPDFNHAQPLESDIGCLSFPSPLPSLPAKADGTHLTLPEEDTYEYEAIMTNIEYCSRERLAACWLPPNRDFLLQVSGSRRGRIMWGILLEWYIGEGWLVSDPNPNSNGDDEQTNAYKVYRLSESGIEQLMNVLRSRLKEEYTEQDRPMELEMNAITEAMEDLAVARSSTAGQS